MVITIQELKLTERYYFRMCQCGVDGGDRDTPILIISTRVK